MNILIVGATRGVGRQLLEQALASGHTVTVLARNPQRLTTQHERLRILKGDILESASQANVLIDLLSFWPKSSLRRTLKRAG